MKVVINSCYGGFSLSKKGVLRYAEIKGFKLYPEIGAHKFTTTYWTVPSEERPSEIDWSTATQAQRVAYNKAYSSATLYDRDIERDDPALVQVVEELGSEADGECAKLTIVEIPDDVKWVIDEYDGMESVEEEHRSWS